ncbi:transcriptional regulator [Streptomyces lincolnensis]|uniref:Transcriptional regulator n=1 Tax=Streptomyces lincolnensis TaxID=1915 RepID=A0A1B1MC86_STRLN|nr:BTAD domain-containing putative transcriptional regulator [Streptomyces lincolnensis]ANS66246.1 transcriptional regulator [Streptomyces lincolnensis]AXG55118.1 transcriptional regulator [Streptomyces lincolnensis]
MRYRILGITQAEDVHGTGIPVGGPRLRALLTALALRPGRVTPPGTLIDEVWADAPPQDAPAALQALVGRLRRTVGKDVIDSVPGGYRLAATADDVDLHVFERLVRHGTAALARGDARAAARDLADALALWRGPALADLPDRTAAAGPEALRREATRARIEADLLLGRAHEAVPELTALTAAHPYDEPLHVLLIRALRDTGRPADALAAYERARRALADGLGTDPGPELRTLHTELLQPAPAHDPARPPRPEHPGPAEHPARPEPEPRHEPSIPTGNIRPRLTTFVGREPELDAIRSEVHRARLVTLTGPGGSGKTRLAEEAAAGLPQAWLVELAPLDRPEAVPGAVVSALGLRETVLMTTELTAPQDDPVALLVEYCAPRSRLLILDNCEHVIEAAAHLAETLLTRCPGLRILATSREPLGVPGESVRPVEPLLPDQAHRLFAERAAAVRPDADTVLGDKEAVAEICRRLDGLPLAIELAAARLRLLTPRQIADRLDDRFRLLTTGSRTVLPRQQTLRAVVDWSWDLLEERERTVLREVSVFAGGWDLAAAEAVCTGPVADLLGALVDKSLIVAAPCARGGGDGMRYRMLETIHEYAVERAAELPGPRAATERRHRAWVRAFVEEADPQLRSAGQLPWISRLETEVDNIRAALRRAVTAGDETEAGALVLAMGWFWWLRNYQHEGAEWADQALRLGAAQDASAGLLPATAALDPVDAFLAAPDGERHHPSHALRMNLRMQHLFLKTEVEPLEGTLDDRLRAYVVLVRDHFARGGPHAARMPGLAWPFTTYMLDRPTDARPLMAAAIANCRAHGDDWAIAVSLMFRTHMVVDSAGGLAGVDEDLEELRVLSRRSGDRWLRAQVASATAEAAMARSRLTEAKNEYEEALRLAREVGANGETPFLLARLAEIAYREGDRPAALIALDEASVAGERYGVSHTRAFVLLMRAQIALDEKDTAGARELLATVRAEIAQHAPPPQFEVMMNAVAAMVTVADAGPEHGLPQLADTVRDAIHKRCAETVVAGLVDGAAALLCDLGDHPRAVRLLAAAEHWRAGDPRLTPDGERAARAETTARAALGPARHGREHAKGRALTPQDALTELDEAVGAL